MCEVNFFWMKLTIKNFEYEFKINNVHETCELNYNYNILENFITGTKVDRRSYIR